MVRSLVLICVFTSMCPALGVAQTLPPFRPKLPEPAVRAADTGQDWLAKFRRKHPGFLPLLGADAEKIKQFYRRDSAFFPADQVQFLYGFGAQKRKGLSADLFALLFPGGWRVALGSSVTAGDAAPGDDPTPEQAIQRIRDGGDMYLSAAYPLLACSRSAMSSYVYFTPRVTFLFDGFGGTDTLTEATESTTNLGAEWYLQLADIDKKGSAFVFVRAGQQFVGSRFKTSAGLDGSRFFTAQIAVGFHFGDLIRVSVQRFKAPPQAAGVSLDELKGWHLVLQLSPRTSKD